MREEDPAGRQGLHLEGNLTFVPSSRFDMLSDRSMLFLRLMGEVAGAFDGTPIVGIELWVEVRAFVVDHKT